jgi:hypothetical protein
MPQLLPENDYNSGEGRTKELTPAEREKLSRSTDIILDAFGKLVRSKRGPSRDTAPKLDR